MSLLPRKIADLLSRDLVHEAVREFHALLRKEPARPDLRVEFAELLARRGWSEEALRHIRQVLPSAGKDGRLMDLCAAALESLPLPSAKTLAGKVRTDSAELRRRTKRMLHLSVMASALLALVLLAALVRSKADSAGGLGPERLCSEFPRGTPARGLPERAEALRIPRVILMDRDGRPVLDKPLSEITQRDWDAVGERLAGSTGRAVFTNPPSISVNRWCVVDFAEGRITGTASLSRAP